MYFLLFLVIFGVIYITSFKDDFKAENIEKVAPVLLATLIIAVILVILGAVL